MKIKVIKNGYYVAEDLTNLGLVDQGTLDSSIAHTLVIDDVWVRDEYEDGHVYFKCIEGKWCNEESDGWWEYKGYEDYFEVIEE
jgi:hypothetical protein